MLANLTAFYKKNYTILHTWHFQKCYIGIRRILNNTNTPGISLFIAYAIGNSTNFLP